MFKKYFIILSAVFCFLFSGQDILAVNSEDITDWYIKNLETDIIVNKDSSLLITENITADCGDLPDKHGIFRVLPTEIKTEKGIFKNPIELVSITDFQGNSYKYQTIKNKGIITWKIGDPNITVSGVNFYKIVYRVKNAIRFGNGNFDELYWNILGTNWQLRIDKFSAKLRFPEGINKSNTESWYYSGIFGSTNKSVDIGEWKADGILEVNPQNIFYPGEGFTISVAFPKNIFTPYVPSFLEKYGEYFWYLSLIIPLIIFRFAFLKWRKYGKDPKMKTPIPPEFGIPEKITPIQMGMILSHGRWKNNFITATIVDLAVRRFITIEQKEEKIIFFTSKEIIIKKNVENYNLKLVTLAEKKLLEKIFEGDKNSVKLSTLKNNFYKYISAIKKTADSEMVSNNWIDSWGNKYSAMFFVVGIILIWFSFWTVPFSFILFCSILFSGIILLFFGLVMPKRTQKGVDLLFKIKGFELYMKQAENYRQQFYEKENIFDKFLPYAMVFGIAKLWAKKMELLYGEDYFKNYHPIWLVGYSSNFDLDSFNSQLNSISAGINNNMTGSSGSNGGGFSGGGGGGGGGGGW